MYPLTHLSLSPFGLRCFRPVGIASVLLASLWTSAASAQTAQVSSLGTSSGWFSDDTRTSGGTTLNGSVSSFAPYFQYPGAPVASTANDALIAGQLYFTNTGSVSGGGSGVMVLDGTDANQGKTSVRYYGNGQGIGTLDGTFSSTFRWYMDPYTTSRTVALNLSVLGTDNFVYSLSWLGTGSTINAWHTWSVDATTAAVSDNGWRIYGNGAPGSAAGAAKSLNEWFADPTYGSILNGATVIGQGFNIGSWQRYCRVGIDWLESSLINGGERVDFVQPPLTVCASGCTHTTIQAAIDAASAGDVIEVAAGTYTENIVVNKSVDLRGPNYATSPNSATRVAEAVLVPSSTNTSTGAVVAISSSNVTFRGFTIDGDNSSLASSGVGLGGDLGTSMDAARAIFLQGNGLSNVTIANNIAKNVVNGIRIEQTTNYFATTAGALRSTNILIDDNRVENTTGTGIRLGNSMYAKVTNNTVSNADTGIAFSSFRISDAGNAADRVVSNNTITARFAGIWTNLFHASPYAITNNTIQVAPPATAMAPTPQNRTAWYGMMYSTVSCPQNFTNQVSLPLVVTPEYWTASGNVIDGAGLESTSTGHGYWLYYVDNNRDANGTDHFGQISGGSVSNVLYGAMLKNRDTHPATSFGTSAIGSHAEIGNVEFNLLAGGTGIHVVDDATWIVANPAPLVNKRDVKVKLGSGVVFNGGAKGIFLSHPVAETAAYTAYASLVGGTVENTAFSGQTTSYIELVNHSADLLATNASFEGALGSAKTDAELFDIERKLVHKLDDTTLGRVTVKANHLHVTSDNTISDAIASAVASETISVEAGTYTENLTINTAHLTVRAVGDVTLNDVADPAAWSGWSGANMPGRAPMVWLKANGITFEGFKLRDYKQKSGSPYIFSVVRVEADDVTVKGLDMQSQYDANYLASASYELIVVAKGNNVRLENNTLSRTKQNTLGTAIIKVERVIAPGDLVGNVLLKDNVVNGGPVAVRLNPNATITVEGNSISDVNFEGLWVALESGASSSGHLVFSGNDVSNHNVTCGTCKGMKITAKPATINSESNSGAMRTALETANPSVPSWQLDWMGPVYNATQDTFTSTIQAAIDAASAGDVIEVAAGTYNEAITINKQLEIRGAGASTILQNTAGNGTVVTLQAAGSGASASSRTVLRDLTISGSTKGIYAQEWVNHVTFDGVTISGNSSYGVHVNNTSGTMNDWSFEDCNFDGNSSGVYVSTAANISGLSITGSTFSNHTNTAFYVGQSSSTPGGLSHVTLTGNTFTSNGPSNNQAALYIEKLSQATISDNTFTNNGLNVNPRGIVINLKYGTYADITVENNTFVENRGATQTNGYGINIQARNDANSYNTFPATLSEVSVSGNAISGFYRGITLENAVDWNTASVTHNALSNCPIGILGVVYGTGNTANSNTSLEISNNSIEGWTLVGIGNYNLNGGTIDATCNWFGAATEPVDGTTVQGSVNYLPWLVSGTDADVASVGFQPEASACAGAYIQVFADSEATVPQSGHTTIQAAIDAATTVAGNEVRVAAGTYNENIILNKRLTLKGAGASTVINTTVGGTKALVVTASGTSATERVVVRDLAFTGPSDTGGSDAISFEPSAAGAHVTVENVTVAGHGHAVHFRSGTMTDARILNCTLNGNGFGVRVASAVTSMDGFVMDGCTLNNNNSSALSINPSGTVTNVNTNYTISNSTFDNNSTAGYANQHDLSFFGFTGNAVLSNVTVTSGNGTAANSNSYGIVFTRGGSEFSPLGTVSLTNVTVEGHVGKGALSFQQYNEISGVSLTDVTLSGCVAPWGQLILSHTDSDAFAVGNTDLASIAIWNTGGANATGATLRNALTGEELDREVLADGFVVENQTGHKVDLGLLGLVTWKPNALFVTPTSFAAPHTTAPSIQRAVDASSAGGTVYVDAGTYAENITTTQPLTIEGVGSSTIIDPVSGHGVTLAAGTDAQNRSVLRNLLITGADRGVTAGGFTTLEGVGSTGNTTGLWLNAGTDLALTNCAFDNNNLGVKIPSTVSYNDIVITGCSFDNNTQHGWYSDANSSAEPTLDNVTITGTSFSGNGTKGLYTERLSNATLTNLTVSGNGGNGGGVIGQGIDLNLKWADYANISVTNSTFSGNGLGQTMGAALAIKGRDDGSTYGANPATLTNVTVAGNTFSGDERAIMLGEPDKANAGPTNVTIEENSFPDPVLFAVVNHAEEEVALTCNWHDATGAGLAATVSGNVEIESALLTGTDGAADLGFQPSGTCAVIGGCNDATACNYTPNLPFPDPADCNYNTCAGCMNAAACNYIQGQYTLSDPTDCSFNDALGICGGDCEADVNNNDICDDEETLCTDAGACNFYLISGATGACEFTSCAGCTVPTACNYDAAATIDANGTCVFASGCDVCEDGAVSDGDADNDGVCDGEEVVGCQTAGACNYNPLATDSGTCDFESCAGCTNPQACNFDPQATVSGTCNFPTAYYLDCDGNCLNDTNPANGICDQLEVVGCMTVGATNYNPLATVSGPCTASVTGCMLTWAPNYNAAATVQGTPVFAVCWGAPMPAGAPVPMGIPTGCSDFAACNYAPGGDPSAACDYSCFGCTNSAACDYSPTATINTGCSDFTSCYGCTDALACNFDAAHNFEDGTCEYTSCAGCTNSTACNYDVNATISTATCIVPDGVCDTCSLGTIQDNDTDNDGVCDADEVAGCTTAGACNYNAAATDDNGTCEYLTCAGCTDASACNYCASCTINTPGSCLVPVAADCEACSGATLVVNDSDTDGICDADEVGGCTQVGACNYDASATDDDGSCDLLSCVGCTNPAACNYSALFTQSNPAACTFPPSGFDCNGDCLDINNNTVCDYLESPVLGCIDATACDYSPAANTQDPTDACDYLLFQGFSAVTPATSDNAANGAVVPSIGGTGGSGTYFLRVVPTDAQTSVSGNKVYRVSLPSGFTAGALLASTNWGHLFAGRYQFELVDDAGCEAVDSHRVVVPVVVP